MHRPRFFFLFLLFCCFVVAKRLSPSIRIWFFTNVTFNRSIWFVNCVTATCWRVHERILVSLDCGRLISASFDRGSGTFRVSWAKGRRRRWTPLHWVGDWTDQLVIWKLSAGVCKRFEEQNERLGEFEFAVGGNMATGVKRRWGCVADAQNTCDLSASFLSLGRRRRSGGRRFHSSINGFCSDQFRKVNRIRSGGRCAATFSYFTLCYCLLLIPFARALIEIYKIDCAVINSVLASSAANPPSALRSIQFDLRHVYGRNQRNQIKFGLRSTPIELFGWKLSPVVFYH